MEHRDVYVSAESRELRGRKCATAMSRVRRRVARGLPDAHPVTLPPGAVAGAVYAQKLREARCLSPASVHVRLGGFYRRGLRLEGGACCAVRPRLRDNKHQHSFCTRQPARKKRGSRVAGAASLLFLLLRIEQEDGFVRRGWL